MVFSSFQFLFAFFPVFFLLYYLLAPRYRNALLLLASLLFYYIGEGPRLLILIVSIVGNFLFGIAIGRARVMGQQTAMRFLLALGVGFNLALLLYFKYADFFIVNANGLLSDIGAEQSIPLLNVVLPLGISFFAFQGISYLMDSYRGDITPTANPFTFATYKAMFPQLIAGPIVRYSDIVDNVHDRRVSADDVLAGLIRFCYGLAKKVLIADTMASTADTIFALPANELGVAAAWLGVIAYALQIYFDFSGYSDMAIGMGRMMGFKYPENFNYPYVAKSIGEFWRRWHMTLSSWFRDYVYIPLGGNRSGPVRTYVNLLIVFALTGFWHGASWTFIIWGLWHGFFMMLERRFKPETWHVPDVLRHGYVLLVVMIGWALFRADSSEVATKMLMSMSGVSTGGDLEWSVTAFTNSLVVSTLFAGIALSFPLYRAVTERLPQKLLLPFDLLLAGMLLLASCVKVLSGSYSPFLYFRF